MFKTRRKAKLLHYDNQDDTKCALLTVYILEKHKNNEYKDRLQTVLDKSYERALKSLPIIMTPVLFLIFDHNKHTSMLWQI